MKLLNGQIEIPGWALRVLGVALAIAIYIGAYKALAPNEQSAVRRAVAQKAIQKIVPKVQGEQMRVTQAAVIGGIRVAGEQMRVGPTGNANCDAEEECTVLKNDTRAGSWGPAVPGISHVAERDGAK